MLFPRDGRRDATSAFWAVALALGAIASFLLIGSPTGIVAAWSAGAAMLALLAVVLGERRLLLGSATFLALALGRTLVELAPPADLFVASARPADGVPALALALGALLTLVVASARVSSTRADRLDETIDRVGKARRGQAVGTAAVLAVYALSLSILGLAQTIGGGDLTADFQRGHTAVSAFWGYDLTMLSSITRALSFLAVGAVLLLAGFLYQRLSLRAEEAS